MDRSSDLTEAHNEHCRLVETTPMQRVERRVIGSDHGATSYTTRDQADMIARLIGLSPGDTLLDVGSGAGWPGIYLAASTGARVVLSDIPFEGLGVASLRLRRDEVDGHVVAASGDSLPFADQSFDAVTSSDVLC
ncbi:MAG: class I SAM-dependent methyltransferase [Acidimicrobiia bacterium]|nr:class I SAM-dependent methyltransferase [Acidimicrobiia bacterium]